LDDWSEDWSVLLGGGLVGGDTGGLVCRTGRWHVGGMVGGLVRPLVDGDVVFFLSLGSLESSTVGEVCFRESLQERSDSLLNVSRELPRRGRRS
jgi:hypothetical protein